MYNLLYDLCCLIYPYIIYVLWPAVSIHVHGSCINAVWVQAGWERPLAFPPGYCGWPLAAKRKVRGEATKQCGLSLFNHGCRKASEGQIPQRRWHPSRLRELGYRGYLELGDTEHQDGSTRPNEARTLALKCFQEGALIQMSCYDGRGRNQGEAIVIFEKWVDKEELLFKCQHLVASNEYYEWWSTREADFTKLVFHVCGRARNRCRTEAADGTETIHLTKWKMASPQTDR